MELPIHLLQVQPIQRVAEILGVPAGTLRREVWELGLPHRLQIIRETVKRDRYRSEPCDIADFLFVSYGISITCHAIHKMQRRLYGWMDKYLFDPAPYTVPFVDVMRVVHRRSKRSAKAVQLELELFNDTMMKAA